MVGMMSRSEVGFITFTMFSRPRVDPAKIARRSQVDIRLEVSEGPHDAQKRDAAEDLGAMVIERRLFLCSIHRVPYIRSVTTSYRTMSSLQD